MNKNILTALAALLVGIGAGWLLKPDPAMPDTPATADSNGKAKPRVTSNSSSPTSRSGPSGPARSPRGMRSSKIEGDKPEEDGTEEAGAGALIDALNIDLGGLGNRLRDQMSKTQDSQLDQLTEFLDLSDEQRQQLTEKFYDPIRELSSKALEPGGTDDLPASAPPDLAKTLNEVLSDDQKASYREHVQTQRRRRDESRALRKLSEFTFLDLSSEQRTAAYDVLYQEAQARPNTSSALVNSIHFPDGAPSISRVVAISTSATTPDGGVVRIEGAPEVAVGGAVGALDFVSSPLQRDNSPEAEAARQEKIDADVSRFEDIFTPDQSEQYRNHLEQKQSGLSSFYSSQRLPPLPE